MKGCVLVEEWPAQPLSSPERSAAAPSRKQRTASSDTAESPEAAYQKYASRRKTARDKLNEARARRGKGQDLKSDEKESSPVVPQMRDQTLIRFGSFDSPEEEADDLGGEQEEKTSSSAYPIKTKYKSPLLPGTIRFGSFDEPDDDEEEEQANGTRQVDGFDMRAALEFLQLKWNRDLQEIGH